MKLLSVSLPVQGFFWCLFLFLLTVIFVHGVKLAKIGYRITKKRLPPEPPKPKEKAPEPVYFIVERKKKRAKQEYTAPREVKFK